MVSDDGRYQTFINGHNFEGDINDYVYDLFVADEQSNQVFLIGNQPDGVSISDGNSGNAELTPDGRFIVFTSSAFDLVPDPSQLRRAGNVFWRAVQ